MEISEHDGKSCLSMTQAAAPDTDQNLRKLQIDATEVRLLYSGVNVGVAVTLIAAAVLAALQWTVVSRFTILAWFFYMLLVSLARFTLGRSYWRAVPSNLETGRWRTAFVIGTGLAGAG